MIRMSMYIASRDPSLQAVSSSTQSTMSQQSNIQATYLKRPSTKSGTEAASPAFNVAQIVQDVIAEITAKGDSAVRQYSEKFDKWSPPSFRLSEEDVKNTMALVDPQTILDIKEVQKNVRVFAEAQLASMKEFEIETQPGVFLGQKNNPIEIVGW